MNDLPETVDGYIVEAKLLQTLFDELINSFQNESQIDNFVDNLEKVLNDLNTLSSVIRDYCVIGTEQKAIVSKNLSKHCIFNLKQCKLINTTIINNLGTNNNLKKSLQNIQSHFDVVIKSIDCVLSELNYLSSQSSSFFLKITNFFKFFFVLLIVLGTIYYLHYLTSTSRSAKYMVHRKARNSSLGIVIADDL
eukprot:TRINITY_DN3245_c1_g1_i1.p1 TRINITY_DN3245_c1_g1~~TRINITY_DN3245_c1_g1_i1.p1  ORF type:complete len:193 (-),score=44.66 TRINITY_DN3245_c1_g1_i1:41-619(-)